MDEMTVEVERPARPAGPPRSRLAAALLNLTGLGLGHAYLERWVRAALLLIGTVVLVVVAFATDASNNPWLWRIIAVVWLGLSAWDGARLAGRAPRPSAGSARVPTVAAVVAVVVVAAGYLAYGAAERSTFDLGVKAEARADCATAEPAFDTVTGVYELTLSSDVPEAATRRTECRDFTAATQAGTGDRSDVAVAAYEKFRHDHPGSVLIPAANENLAQLYLGQVGDAVTALAAETGAPRAITTQTAFETLLLVRRELGDTPSAARVLPTMHDLATTAESPLNQQQFCETLPVLDYEVTLPAAETDDIVPTAQAHRAQAMLGCGLAQFRAGQFPESATQFQDLVTNYPNDAGVPQAAAALIAATVALKTTDQIPVPAPLNKPGSLRVTIYNATSGSMHVQMTGTSAADFTLPSCAACQATLPANSECPDAAGKPSQTVQIDPGLYHVLLSDQSGTDDGTVKTTTPTDGDYICVFSVPLVPDLPTVPSYVSPLSPTG